MNIYSPDHYDKILECYEYEIRNPSVYGNVIRREMELTKSGGQLQLNLQRDENYI